MPPGLSIPTSPLASLLRAPQWLQWLASMQDAPLLALLGLVLLVCGLGLWWRHRRP